LRDFFAAVRLAFSYQQIADVLNMRGERTRPAEGSHGAKWQF
jgi:hypothetical protein